MKELTLTIGQNVAGKPRWSLEEIVAATAEVLAVEGLTAYPVAGMWRSETEASIRIEIVADESKTAHIAAALPELAAALQQVEIMAEVRESAAEFVKAASPAERPAA